MRRVQAEFADLDVGQDGEPNAQTGDENGNKLVVHEMGLWGVLKQQRPHGDKAFEHVIGHAFST